MPDPNVLSLFREECLSKEEKAILKEHKDTTHHQKLLAWREAIANFNDPFWIASQYITEQKSPSKIASETEQKEYIIVEMLKELGLWSKPEIVHVEGMKCDVEDEDLCKRFLSWYIEECGYPSHINQRGNRITVFYHTNKVFSSGLQVLHSREHYIRNAYFDYMKSEKWKQKTLRLRTERKACELCGSNKDLCCHHLTYDHLGDEPDEDLQVLCELCHKRIHNK